MTALVRGQRDDVGHRSRGRRSTLFGIAFLLGAASLAGATIPEPEHRFFGVVRADGGVVLDAEVSLHRDDCDSELLAASQPGEVSQDPELFLLRVSLESPLYPGEARTGGVARVGDSGTVCVRYEDAASAMRTVAVQRFYVGERGLAVRLDLDLGSIDGSGSELPVGGRDVDSDGVPDFADNCSTPNGSQLDANGNGVGDACEAAVNRPVEDTVQPVLQPGNPADTTGAGSVDYEFEIAEIEVSNVQYVEFLNAVASTSDPFGFFNGEMTSAPRGGIVREIDDEAYRYRVKPSMGNKPVNFVSWVDAASYANWIFKGRPVGEAVEVRTGAFDLTGADPGADAQMAEGGWSLPTEDEWYKAAYYDPDRPGVPYWLYPTREDIDPILAAATASGDVSNPGPGVANYDEGAFWNGQQGNLTSVGSAGATSFYGAFDLGGNVAEWLADDALPTGERRVRGGSHLDGISALASSAGDSDTLRHPGYEGSDVGIRVVLAPEPATGLVQVVAVVVVMLCRTRRRG